MMLSRRVALIAISLAMSATVAAADLLDIFREARVNDPIFLAAHATWQAGQEQLPQGRALLLPRINLTAGSTINDQTIQSTGIFSSGNSRYNSNRYAVNFTQPLFNQPGWVAYTASELKVAQSDAQFRLAEQDLILRTSQAYIDVLVAENSVRLVAVQKQEIAEQLQQAKRRFEIGSATITDTHEAQARFDLTTAQEVVAQNNLAVARYRLQQLSRVNVSNIEPLSKTFRLEVPQPNGVEQWVEIALQNNPQLIFAKIGVDLADKGVTQSRGAHYPTIDLVATYSNSVANGGIFGVGSDTTSKTVGVEMNLPLFQGGATTSKWREAQANHERARQELENMRRTISLQVHQAYLGVVSGIAQVKALRQARISGESVLEASTLGREVGVRTNLDVLNAQQQLYTTQRDLFQAEYSYLLSKLQLKAAVGALSESDLAEINQSLH